MIRRISLLVIFHGFIIYHEIKTVPYRIRFRFSKKYRDSKK